MADVYTRIGYIKGATGATGAQGAKGDQGDAATIQVGTVTTVAYGQTANVVNSGTSGAAVFDFTIPQGRPGEQTTDMQNLTLGSITTSSASFPIPAVGETGKVLWGKVVKWFSDMSALVATKLNASNVVNNLTTTASGYALDARQGKALNDVVSSVSSTTVSNSTYFATDFGLRKAGTMVSLTYSGRVKAIPAGNDYVLIDTIPAAYRPAAGIVQLFSPISGNPIILSVTQAGALSFYAPSAITADTQYRIVMIWSTL